MAETKARELAELARNVDDSKLTNPTLTGTTTVSQLNADNIQIDGNTISSTDTNGDINLTPNGTGSVVANKIKLTPQSQPASVGPAGTMYVDSSDNILYVSNGSVWIGNKPTIVATGGTITEITDNGINYRVHTFTSSGTFEFEITYGSGKVEYLVVGGGGGGGIGNNPGGGGGAGGYRSSVSGESSGGGSSAESDLIMTAGSYTVTVGAGGAPNNDGSPSVFSTITSNGGGSGSPIGNLGGNPGGSGGGASYSSTGGAGTSGQGYKGGDAGGYSGNTYATGGGGGASQAGDDGNLSTGKSGDGGDGVSSSINGTSTTRAGGGGGSMYISGTRGYGGAGGGGDGGSNSSNSTSGTANTGSGGGGYTSAVSGGQGGSGIVIIRYQI